MTDMKTYSLAALVAAITKNPGAGPMLLVTVSDTASYSRVYTELSALSEGTRNTLSYEGSAVVKFKTREDATRTLEQIKKDAPQTSCLHLHAVLFHNGIIVESYHMDDVDPELTLTPV